jgi:hypothetical protein
VPDHDLRQEVPPESVQAAPTLLERASAEGLGVLVVGRSEFHGSGLTRATLRGGEYRPVDEPQDQLRTVTDELSRPGRRLVSAYYPGIDYTAHRAGVGSDPWRDQLRAVDRLVATLTESLGPGAGLLVTADHGLVNLQPEEKIDLADEPRLAAEVRLLAGEGRARHVHVRPGAQNDVLATWRATLGDRMWVVSREEAIAAGWFGTRVVDEVRERIGDLVAAAAGPVGVFERAVDPFQPTLVGHHGSMTPGEQLIPLLVFRG